MAKKGEPPNKKSDRRIKARKLKSSGLTYKEVGRIMGISRQRAHQLISLTDNERLSITKTRWGVCERCGTQTDDLDIHHVEYSTNENLQILCPSCHWIADQEIGTRPTEKPRQYKLYSTNTSGYRGICFHKPTKLWMAKLCYKNIQYVKYFHSSIEAAKGYDKLVSEHGGRGHGGKGILNFPDQ